jgi:hypothetical protein
MRAVLRLVYSYFTCTPVIRAFTVGGLALILISLYVVTSLPQSEQMLAFAFAGTVAFFMGSGLMPLMFGRLARSHSIRVLPHGRLKLLLSAFVTVAIVALPSGVLTPFAYVAGVSGKASDLAKYPQLLDYTLQLGAITYTYSVLLAGWLYLAMWFVTSQRNMVGFVKGLLVILILILAPARGIQELSITLKSNLIQIAVTWSVFCAGFLLWPRWSAVSARLRPSRLVGMGRNLTRQISGREIDLMLGTANPWLLIVAQVAPIVIATRIGDYSPAVWLYYLTIFSTVAGAISGQAAERSRALWLRGNWSRADLFSEVERSFWRHNSFVLGSLLAFMVAMGSYSGLPVELLAAGIPLLALGTVLSTYLGLMITRGLRWIEAVLAIVVMLALMAVALLAARSSSGDLYRVFVIEVLLIGAALVLRQAARQRWLHIDWTICRPDRALSMRAAS